ncbi:glycosyltransferase family 4 protein [Rhodoplanes roseus]|nr:glycosyltransferase family 1 protein [Rhodoplanes roseus]
MRILIDARVSSIPEGTGIATYARTLANNVSACDHEVTLLRAENVGRLRRARRTDRVPSAVLAFDHPGSSRPPESYRTSDIPGWVRNRFWSLRGLADLASLSYGTGGLDEIDDLSTLQTQHLHDRFGRFASVINARNVFDHALERFRKRDRILTLRPSRRIDVAHFTSMLPIRVAGARTIYTIYDLMPLVIPFATLDNKEAYFRLARKCCEIADAIVTISEFSRREIASVLGVPDDKIFNASLTYDIPPAVLARDVRDITASLEKNFKLKPREYFLMVGAIEPRKNVARAVEAYLSSGVGAPLVICGPRNALSAEQLRSVPPQSPDDGDEGRDRNVILLEYLPRSLVFDLIQGARALVIPSIAEGFGLTALEALALGTPVIASTAGALPEVCGTAALYVDPHDVGALKEAFRTVYAWTDSALEAAGRRGRRQAGQFSPEAFRARLSELYGRLAAA